MSIISDDDFQAVTKVTNIKYIRIVKYNLKILNAWPSTLVGEMDSKYIRIRKTALMFVEAFCLLPQALYIRNSTGVLGFHELGHSYITMFMNIVAVSRLVLTFSVKYYEIVANFVNKIHLFHFKHQSEYAMETHLLVHKLSRFFTLYINLLLYSGVCVFNLTLVYTNYVSGALTNLRETEVPFQHALYMAVPFDYTTEYKGAIFIFWFNVIISYICSSIFCTFDLFLSLLVFHLWGHLRILIHNLENFPRPKQSYKPEGYANEVNYEWYTKEENKEVADRLKDIINHHIFITDYIKQMMNIFGPSLFVIYAFHQVSECLLLLQLAQLEAKAFFMYGPLTLTLVQQLIQLSFIFDMLQSMTSSLVRAVYSLPWECMDNPNRRIVNLLLSQCYRPLTPKALGVLDVGCKTMVAIFKNTLSYFIMLQTVAGMDK
uniref:Odorant receptor n=1 Tax=Leucinodes orbonalis TaxID=711050 RepID=A0AAU0QMQ0_9NEOP|nr:odorant receptor [Leucinodes orbonalis]